MVVGNLRTAQVVVSEDALFHNISNAKKRLTNGEELFMVVKANGYGHGAVQVANVAKKAGATGFCVAIIDEALELRAAGFTEPILVLGITDPSLVRIAQQNNLSLTVGSIGWLHSALPLLKSDGNQLHIHLALDTGMSRIGFQTTTDLKRAITLLNNADNQFDFQGIFTHFATADSADDKYFQFQLNRFHEFMKVVEKRPRYVHVANSATSLWHQVCEGNMIRLGISAYGLNPSGREITKVPYPLLPVLSVTSELVQTKKVAKGTQIGYGATYTADKEQWIGTVPMGYADGISRKLQGFSVLVDGDRCPIVGRVCMDQFMIQLPKQFSYGTKVTIIGESEGQRISADDLANYIGTINYEVICGFSNRLKRVYY